MKKVVFILLALLASRVGVCAQGDCIPVYTTKESELAYEAGEKATYTLRYKFGLLNTDVAKAYVSLDTVRVDGTKAFHCKVFGQTAGIFRRMFDVREDFQSWFSCEGVRPLRFYRDTYECGYKSLNEYRYVWDAEQPYIDAQIYNTSIDSTQVLQIPLSDCTFDLPSLYYFARNIDMSKVRKDVKYPMTFAIDETKYNVYYIYKGKTRKNIAGLGTVPCLWFQAKLVAGEVFSGKKDMNIYVSDDLNRVPLFFSAELSVGEAQGRLAEVSGLKYPMSWKKK